jgi:putative spermidine/putrescine transport system permease protein
MCVWLLAPIVIVVILAFSGDGYLRFPPTSFSLQWFDRFFGNLQWQRALLSSLIIGAIASPALRPPLDRDHRPAV